MQCPPDREVLVDRLAYIQRDLEPALRSALEQALLAVDDARQNVEPAEHLRHAVAALGSALTTCSMIRDLGVNRPL